MAAKIRFILKRVLTLITTLGINGDGDSLEINDEGDLLDI